jgi:AcrR family transcriptional regulator
MAANAPAEPLTRGHKKKERTRNQLIAAAIDVIAERGEGFSISDIAARAGVSNGTFYNYFDDRDELIDAVVPDVLAAFAVASASAVESDDPAMRFAVITALALRQADVAPHTMGVVLRLDAVQRAILDGAALAHLRDDLADGVAAGRFVVGTDGAVVDVVVGALLLAVRRIIDQPVADDYPARIVAQLLRVLGLSDTEAETLAAQAALTADQLAPSR